MNRYDRIIQENIQPLTLSLVKKVLGIKNAEITILPRKIQKTLEKETDSVLLFNFADGRQAIGNVEWQMANDPRMHERMLLQQSILYTIHKLPVIGIVIYAGDKLVNLETIIKYENFFYQYHIIDLAQYNPYDFLDSNVPEEVIMAILAGNLDQEQARLLTKNILSKLHVLLGNNVNELGRKIYQLEILSEVKNYQLIVREEENNMPFVLDNNKSIRYQEGLRAGLEKAAKILLLSTNYSPEKISQLLELPKETVQKIKMSCKTDLQ